MTRPVVRPGTPDDAAAVAAIWRDGWRDGHLGLVPDALVAVRTDESFSTRAAQRVDDTTVAVVDTEVAGFVMVDDDEVEQVYVSSRHRGKGVADVLLAEAERQVRASGAERAWLAVAEGNARARAFYERMGWHDEGPFDYAASVEDGSTVAVPCRRYVKPLPTRLEAQLEQDDVAPDAAQLPDSFTCADLAEAVHAVQRDARLVLREDPRLQRPEAPFAGALDQRREQRPANASASRVLGDVDALLADATVDGAARVGNDRDPAGDLAVDLGDEAVVGQVSGVPVLPRRHRRLEGGVTRCDPLGEDRGDGRPVRGEQRANQHEMIQSRLMDEVNIYGDEWTDGTEEPGFRNRERPLGETLGAEKLGGTIYLIEPGQRICPYHWHFGEEEWVIVLEGTVALRTPDGERELARGDVVAFPTGPGGAHDIRGSGSEAVARADAVDDVRPGDLRLPGQ